jgi:hypoxanthine-guanine phosphoribosyltransferase
VIIEDIIDTVTLSKASFNRSKVMPRQVFVATLLLKNELYRKE